MSHAGARGIENVGRIDGLGREIVMVTIVRIGWMRPEPDPDRGWRDWGDALPGKGTLA